MDKTNELENLKKALSEARGKTKEKDSTIDEKESTIERLEQKIAELENKTNNTKEKAQSSDVNNQNTKDESSSELEQMLKDVQNKLNSLESQIKVKPLDEMKNKYPDFEEYKDFALKYKEKNNLSIEDAYLLAKTKIGDNTNKNNTNYNEQQTNMDYGDVKGGTQMNEDKQFRDGFDGTINEYKDVFSEYANNDEKKGFLEKVTKAFKKDRPQLSKSKNYVSIDEVLDNKL